MTTVAQLKKRIEKNLQKISDLKHKIKQDSKELLQCSLINIFKRNKSFKSFSWTQYTPYWNDGDTCLFTAHTDYINIDDDQEGISDYELKNLYEKLLKKDEEIKKLQNKNKTLETKSWEHKNNLRQIKELEDSDIKKVKEKLDFILDIQEVFNTIDEDTLRDMFGDHCKVTATCDGTTIESWEHD